MFYPYDIENLAAFGELVSRWVLRQVHRSRVGSHDPFRPRRGPRHRRGPQLLGTSCGRDGSGRHTQWC